MATCTEKIAALRNEVQAAYDEASESWEGGMMNAYAYVLDLLDEMEEAP